MLEILSVVKPDMDTMKKTNGQKHITKIYMVKKVGISLIKMVAK